jgi:nicotinic acid mononucleotide adenylyltransferase
MLKLLIKETYGIILKRLLSSKWLTKWNLDKNLISEYLNSDIFQKDLYQLITDKAYSCKSILNLCQALLDSLVPITDNFQWLEYIYQYALSKSFNEAVTIELHSELDSACELYLNISVILNETQKKTQDNTWQSLYPMEFLCMEEEAQLEDKEEYVKFVDSFKNEYIYEMMKLSDELYSFNTLDHICGVHYLALYISRQLKAIGISIDLGRVSGSAAGHDIGKYGCVRNEAKRVPYLHYYYSDKWFMRHDINYIRNIAINHSTWDLELENLSIEGLILIYSDFRVKNKIDSIKPLMYIYTLEESFDVILKKLDNLDEAKEKRYHKVYSKLKDFEDFLRNMNITTEIVPVQNISYSYNLSEPQYELMHGKTVIDNLKFISIRHNIQLMYKLRNQCSLDEILESARSEKDWKNLREYLQVFEEYSTYLTQNQKLQTIKFLYEHLIHPEDDIRRHSSEILGTLIAIFDEDYSKEIPNNVILQKPTITSFSLLQEYITLLLFPENTIIPLHRTWLGHSLSIFTNSLFFHCKKSLIPSYRTIYMKYFTDKNFKNSETILFLLESAKYIPLLYFSDDLQQLFDFILYSMKKRSNTLRICAYECAIELISKLNTEIYFYEGLKNHITMVNIKSTSPVENMLLLKLSRLLALSESIKTFEYLCKMDEKKSPEMFLNNLKTATEWIKKKNQVDLLLNYTLNDSRISSIHTAIHFCNLLKVSAIESVRNHAGSAILQLMPQLSLSERNEISVELLRAIEIEGHHFTEYIPNYLGIVILYLQPKELDEILDDLTLKIKISKASVKALILKTIGITIEHYEDYKVRFDDNNLDYDNRMLKLLGILLNGLSDFNNQVKQAAYNSLGQGIFSSEYLNLSQKYRIFNLIAKKILTLIANCAEDDLLFLSASAALKHIYKFISEYIFLHGDIKIYTPKKIAFFPGSFDPFSLSHKEIAKTIRNCGFEVYLSVDEFSWSKKTLPNLLRRNILNMSIADELNMYLFPHNLPINIANEDDLFYLKKSFSTLIIYVVVGSDVILNASSYNSPKTPNSIHSFNHIIFERAKSKKLEAVAKQITGEIEWITLAQKYNEISSTQIRTYIDENRDISSLVDPMVQQYIYENGFYQRESQDKSLTKPLIINIEICSLLNMDILQQLSKLFNHKSNDLQKLILSIFEKPSGRLLLIRDNSTNKILAFSLFHWLRSNILYEELLDSKAAEHIRQNSIGRILLIDGLFIAYPDKNKKLEQILLTETLAFAISRDYEYAIFKAGMKDLASNTFFELLRLQGFMPIDVHNKLNPIWCVNMSSPCILNLDIENVLKEPFRSDLKVTQTIASCRKRLQESLTALYPGKLMLSFDSDMLHQQMIKKICYENNVSTEIYSPRKLGSHMCVPYGDILDRYVVPNTVTKSLHTEKLFQADMCDFRIGEFPHYLQLENQVKTLKSFKRSVILVDNLLHKGYRLKALDPLFSKEGIKIQKVIAGILSGRGKDLMSIQNKEVDSVYFIPKLKLWFSENSLYPFIGGDFLWRGAYPQRNLYPSINLILPYTSPTFIKDASTTSIFRLSKVCLENSINILYALENQYHLINGRNLNLASLGQVFTIPRCPDHGKNVDYNLSLTPSHYLLNDLELLNRLDNIIR